MSSPPPSSSSPPRPSSSSPPRRAALARVPHWLPGLVRLLDSAFQVPGTRIRVGLDAILGLIAPGAGDAVGGLAAFSVLFVAFQQRVPKVVLARMLVNVAVDALFGLIPVIGDLFDVAFRANQKNLELLEKHSGQGPTRPAFGDYAVVIVAGVSVLLLLALPVLVGLGAVHLVASLSDGG